MAKKAAAKKPAKKTTAAKAASKADDFRAKSADELSTQLVGLKKEQFNLRFQRAMGQQEGVARVKEVRRTIARVKTIQTEHARSAVAK